MINNKRVLAIIPARGGSKGLPGKNIRDFCGKPLIAWSIGQALGSSYIDRTIVSTDSLEIADIALEYGAEVPFIRPERLSTDAASTLDVLQHAIAFLSEQCDVFDYLVVLEPTSPLRDVGDIDGAIEKLSSTPKAESIVGVAETESTHPSYLFEIKNDFLKNFTDKSPNALRRQDLSGNFYYLEGSIYVGKIPSIFERNGFYHEFTLPWIVSKEKALEIDDFFDFIQAEAIMRWKLGPG